MSSKINSKYLLLGFLCLMSINLSSVHASEKGGGYCLLCTAGVGLLEQLAQIHNESITNTMERSCKLFHHNPDYRKACEMIFDYVGPALIDLFYLHCTPDVICARIGLCPFKEGIPKCHLFPRPLWVDSRKEKMRRKPTSGDNDFLPLCAWPGASVFCELLERSRDLHVPVLDLDHDGFSTRETFQGSSWRGKDCDDWDVNFHPGLKPLNHDAETDSNCNGIYGVNYETGEPYEKTFCEHSSPRGLMIIGDSVGAHFHIPEQWVDPRQLDSNALIHIPFILSNNFDWPMTSFSTGYKNLTWQVVDGYTVSVYDFLKQRNHCNHRDYHNFGVNGDGSSGPLSYLNESSIRNQKADVPVLLLYEFVGNDVCNSHEDTLAHMTTPKQMRKNIIRTLDILDTYLPNGSHILMTGLANGSVLYEALRNRLYPLGRLNKDVSYPEFYEFLTCIGVNPCSGWLTTNDTLRELTTKRAFELSDVVRDVAKEYKHRYAHFDIEYIKCPFTEIIEMWIHKHGKETVWQLIEPTDGFHPNQLAHSFIAQFVWDHMERNLPHFVGPVNPHNSHIAATFRDQGGY